MTDSRKKMRACIVLAILAALLILGIWVDINAGYRHISPEEIWNILWGKGEKGVRFTLLQLRLPRVLASLLAGAGLSVSGCVIQGVSRNEMAEPGILGINAGAGLFVAAFIVFFPGTGLSLPLILPLLAFAGSLAAALCGYRLALTRRGLSPGRLFPAIGLSSGCCRRHVQPVLRGGWRLQFCGPCLSPSGPSPDRLQLPAAASCGGTYRRRADDLFGYYIPYTSVAG